MKMPHIAQIAKSEFLRRLASNPSYSLRAYSKYLGVSHSVLSLYFSGKRGISEKSANKILNRLGLEPIDTHDHSKNSPKKGARSKEYFEHSLQIDQHILYADWVHFAILSLLDLRIAKFQSAWIAKRLSISEARAKDCMLRLQKFKLVEKRRNGKWKQASRPIDVNNTVPSASITSCHRDLINLSLSALDQVEFSKRSYSGAILSFSDSDMLRAKDKINRFRNEFVKEFSESANQNSVYAFTLQLFPLTGEEDEKSV